MFVALKASVAALPPDHACVACVLLVSAPLFALILIGFAVDHVLAARRVSQGIR